MSRSDGMTLRARSQQVRYHIMQRYDAKDVQIAWNQSQIPAEYDFKLPGAHTIGFMVTLNDMTVVVPVSKKAMMLEGNEASLLVSIGRYLAGLLEHRIDWMERLQERLDEKD